MARRLTSLIVENNTFMRKKNILLVLATFAFSQILTAQNEREITLNEAIALARTQSVDAAVALNEL